MTRPVPVDHLDRLLDRAEKRDIRYFLDESEKSRQMKQQRSEQADKWIDEFEDQEFNEFIEERKKAHRAEAERKKEEQQTGKS
ncbi:hypothetical protein FACS18942_01910 [Planctomycetales bacterium]|nr:hypothetical protein FACS18942_01910 [Planctomycetales bacterium]